MSSPEFRKTLLIGLGGAGQEILLRTKRLFLDTYGIVPPSVKMLSLDTDASIKKLVSANGEKEYTFAPDEFIHLAVPQPADFLRSSAEARAWHADKAPVGAIHAGAVRQTGRLAFFYHFNEIRNRISRRFESFGYPGLFNDMQDAHFKLAGRDPEIYVCGSIAGGTGSGTFLDMGIVLRNLQPNALIHGLFLSFWPYRYKPFAHRTKGNAYAALTELDNLQSIMYHDKAFQPYQVRYADDCDITVANAPYDIFHILDGRDEYGNNKGEVEEICDNLADAIFLSMGSMAYPVNSAVDNLRSAINAGQEKLWEGRYPRYSSLGVSSIHYPAKELHRAAATANAVSLCNAAIASLDSASAAPLMDVGQHVSAYIRDKNLTREQARAKLCPDQGRVELDLDSHEIADPAFPDAIKDRFKSEQRAMENRIAQHFKSTGEACLQETADALAQKLASIAADPKLDAAFRYSWSSALLAELGGLAGQIAQELQDATKEIDDLQQSAGVCLELAVKSLYIPLIVGPRKSAVRRWVDEAASLLTAIKKKLNLEKEQAFFAQLLARLEKEASAAVPGIDQIHLALAKAKTALTDAQSRAMRVLAALQKRQSYILLGGGNWIIVKQEDGRAGCLPLEQLFLGYEEFTQQQAIHHVQAYLDLDKQGAGRLPELFLNASEAHLDLRYKLSSVSVGEALESLAGMAEGTATYSQQQFARLFQLAGAMWNYDHSRITPDRGQHLENILNLGFDDHETGHQAFHAKVNAACNALHVLRDPSYSATGDPSRIWLLNFAAVLPAYLMTGLNEARRSYDNEITPSYHIDKRLEMDVPDLFPISDVANRALRVLGMAIVPGVDVIKDTKLAKGHKFSFEHGEIDKVWYLFREMYDEIKDGYVQGRDDNLLDLLSTLLKEKVSAIPPDQIVTLVKDYLARIGEKLANRDFSRLYSARLTYRELCELELFLDDKLGKKLDRKGYGMDIDRYIEGRPR